MFQGTLAEIHDSFPSQFENLLRQKAQAKNNTVPDLLFEIYQLFLICQPHRKDDPWLYPSKQRQRLKQLLQSLPRLPRWLTAPDKTTLSVAEFKALTDLRRTHDLIQGQSPDLPVYGGTHPFDLAIQRGLTTISQTVHIALASITNKPFRTGKKPDKGAESFLIGLCNIYYRLTGQPPHITSIGSYFRAGDKVDSVASGTILDFLEPIYTHFGMVFNSSALHQRLYRINKGDIHPTVLGICPAWPARY